MEILEAFNPFTAVASLRQFLETGGDILFIIMIATFFLWALIVERYWYFWAAHGSVERKAKNEWESRSDHSSWGAHKIREQLLSLVRQQTATNLG